MYPIWYKEETLATQVTAESQVTTASNHTLYAKWVDSQPPEKPSTPDLIAGHDTGSSDTDNITQWWWNITIQGTAEANSIITIYKNEIQYGQIQANASGNWSASVNNNQNEWTNWKVTATDAAGNVSEMSDALAIYSDTTIPTVPTVTYNSGANTCTWKNNYNITVSSTDTGAGVWKYEYDRDGDGVADFEWFANWILEDRDGDGIDDYLVQDTNFVPNDGYQSCSTRFRAVDCTGNVSDWTEVHHIHMDTSAPTPTTWYFGTVSNTLVELYIQVTDNIGISSVQVPTSTEAGGYNDWIWYNATLVDASQNLYKAYIYPSNFGKYGTNYKSHLYIYDHAGNGGFYWESSPVWVPALNYTVTLDSQSATYAGTTSVTATYGSAMPSITVPTKNGYVFGGYYTSTGGSGTQYYNANGTSARNYDMTSNTTLYAKWITATTSFTYTGGIQTYTASSNGVYKLEVWGAGGGENNGSGGNPPGAGGYSVGYVELSAGNTLYVCVGGAGSNGAGGYNGGGAVSGDGSVAGGGGGATHIASVNGVLSSLSSNTQAVYIVAGGGGGEGAGWNNGDHGGAGGAGGGTSGGDGSTGRQSAATGGTQSAGGVGYSNNSSLQGSFGKGGTGISGSSLSGGPFQGGGGGGGWYGGGAGNCNYDYGGCGMGGAGGSGYIGGVPQITVSGVTYSPSTTAGAGSAACTNGMAQITFVAAN